MKRVAVLTVRSLLIVVLSFFYGSGQAWAQQDHSHESPHGGEVRTMGDYHVEFLVVEGEDDKGHVVVFLLNGDLDAVPVDELQGVVYVTVPDAGRQTLTLVATTEMPQAGHHEEAEHEEEATHQNVSHLQAEVDLEGVDTFDAVVSLTLGGERTNLRYQYVRVLST